MAANLGETTDQEEVHTGRDPFGIYMAGFTLNTTPAEARTAAESQRALAEQAGDADDVAWWDKVLAYLTVTGR